MTNTKKLTLEQQILVEQHLSVVHWIIVKNIHVNHTIYGMSYEDLYQEGCLWLCRAATTYNDALSLFPTYAKKVVRNGLISYCRSRCNKEKHFERLEVGENGELLIQGAYHSTPDESNARISSMETLDLLESRKAAYQGVAKLGIEALSLRIRGYEVKDIAALYQVPSSHVGAWISRAVKKLQSDPDFMSGL